MHGHRLHIHRTARGRIEASIGVGLAVIAAGLVLDAPAFAASPSVSQLRAAFSQTFLALRVTGNAAICASATSEGKIALVEMVRGEERYLPSTTCPEAFAGGVSSCGNLGVLHLSTVKLIAEKAVIHLRGNRGTVQLVDDFYCKAEQYEVGAGAVRLDPMGTSRWLRKHGQWLFDNRPTGTYSPAGRKAVAMLRAALNGRVVTWAPPAGTMLAVPFCTNGTTQPIVRITKGEPVTTLPPALWFVGAGELATGELPFDAQGDPQGMMNLTDTFIISWNVKLAGGVLTVTEPATDESLPVSAPGTAGC
jgi:hypothetical protein